MNVILRRVKKGAQAGDIIAIFPAKKRHPLLESYMHIGQHGMCSEDFLLEDTVPTKSGADKYGILKEELVSIGYEDINVIELSSIDWFGEEK